MSPVTFEALYERECTVMRRLAYLVTGSYELADEIVQDGFAEVHRRWATIDQPGAYLRTCVVRRAVAVRRRRAVEDELLRRGAGLSWVVPPAVGPPEHDTMWRALTALPARRRAALVLRFYEDQTTDEIAVVLGCTPATVRSLVSRGLEQLRSEISSWTT